MCVGASRRYDRKRNKAKFDHRQDLRGPCGVIVSRWTLVLSIELDRVFRFWPERRILRFIVLAVGEESGTEDGSDGAGVERILRFCSLEQ